MSTRSQPVGFRLSAPAVRRLTAAAARHGLTPGTYARRLVLAGLEDDAGRKTLDELAVVRDQLARLRADLTRIAVALLTDAGKAELAEAEAWARENLPGSWS
jgi:hypothetical protein